MSSFGEVRAFVKHRCEQLAHANLCAVFCIVTSITYHLNAINLFRFVHNEGGFWSLDGVTERD